MADVNMLYSDLVAYIRSLEAKFIDPYIPTDPSIGPADYDFDVRAYCVLSHASMEEFCEQAALHLMSKGIEQWKMNHKVSDTLLTLISYYGLQLKIDEDERNQENSVFDYVRVQFLDQVRDRFSKDVYNNHGVSIKYLRNLLIPVAIDIKQDASLLNSLKQLANARGDYDHRNIKKNLPPEDAKKFVGDCLMLCEDIKDKAVLKFV